MISHLLCRTHQPQCGSREPKQSAQERYCPQFSTGSCTTWGKSCINIHLQTSPPPPLFIHPLWSFPTVFASLAGTLQVYRTRDYFPNIKSQNEGNRNRFLPYRKALVEFLPGLQVWKSESCLRQEQDHQKLWTIVKMWQERVRGFLYPRLPFAATEYFSRFLQLRSGYSRKIGSKYTYTQQPSAHICQSPSTSFLQIQHLRFIHSLHFAIWIIHSR